MIVSILIEVEIVHILQEEDDHQEEDHVRLVLHFLVLLQGNINVPEGMTLIHHLQ